jgi:hypothetical protein
MALTGKFSLRKSLTGKIILQVEEEVKSFWRRSKPGPLKRRWRDATLMDLAAPELRPLIDMRFKPQYRYQSQPAPEAVAAPPAEPALDAAAPAPLQKADGELRKTAH